MKLAIIADVHSNLHALDVASKLIDGLAPDVVICAGDVVGYGAFPNECCSEVERICSCAIAGNHDRAAGSRDMSGMNPFAAAAALWTANELNDDSMQYLSALKPFARLDAGDRRIAVFHGSPKDPGEYVEEDVATEGLLADGDCDILVLGHTHMSYVRRSAAGLIVNPGSVGQPRDGDRRGSFAVVETDSMASEIVRFEYPVQEAADAVLSAGLPHILAERLFIGR